MRISSLEITVAELDGYQHTGVLGVHTYSKTHKLC